jgi:hypothetical protein
MKWLLRIALLAALALALAPEIARYRGEHLLAQADGRLSLLLRGGLQGEAAVQAARTAAAEAEQADNLLVQDTRAALARGIALILLRRADEAQVLLQTAVARAERPELSLNLGRARAALGDEAGARRAYLRTAWASPYGIATLPREMREQIQSEMTQREAQLRDGQLTQIPPL